MGFFSFIVLLAIAYLVWRVTDQLPDLIFRLSEIQRDVAEIRRRLADSGAVAAGGTTAGSAEPRPGPGTGGTSAGTTTGTPAGTGTAPRTGTAPGPTTPATPEPPPHGEESGADYSRS